MGKVFAFLLGAAAAWLVTDRYQAGEFSRWLNDASTRQWLLKVWGIEPEQHQWTYTTPSAISTTWVTGSRQQ